jgi:hypothetical protein
MPEDGSALSYLMYLIVGGVTLGIFSGLQWMASEDNPKRQWKVAIGMIGIFTLAIMIGRAILR